MKYSELRKIKDLLYINKDILSLLFPDESPINIKLRISYLAKQGKLIRLRRNIYVIFDEYIKLKDYPEYIEVLACSLREPSYLSLEYVLRKYDVLTEATYGFTLVTTKKKARYVNNIGTFSYKQISNDLLRGFKIMKFLDYEYYEATKAKALFDWLYYRADKIPFKEEGINIVEDLRLNLDSFKKVDYKELESYVPLAKNWEDMGIIVKNIIKNGNNNK